MDVERTRKGGNLVEYHLVVERRSRREGETKVDVAPLNDERSVGSSAEGPVEHAARGAVARLRGLVHPHGAYGIGSRVHRHTGDVEAREIGAECQFTVRAGQGGGVGGVINLDREWEWDREGAVVAVDAQAGGAGQI